MTLCRCEYTLGIRTTVEWIKCRVKNGITVQCFSYTVAQVAVRQWMSLHTPCLMVDHAQHWAWSTSDTHLTLYPFPLHHSPRKTYAISKKQVGLARYGSEYKHPWRPCSGVKPICTYCSELKSIAEIKGIIVQHPERTGYQQLSKQFLCQICCHELPSALR